MEREFPTPRIRETPRLHKRGVVDEIKAKITHYIDNKPDKNQNLKGSIVRAGLQLPETRNPG